MYTDTKNLANSGNNVDITYARLQTVKSKGRLGKVWKPLLRLITPKNEATQKHPNNINLNNVQQPVIPETIAPLIVDLPPKTLPTEEELQQWNLQNYSQYDKAQQEAHIALIKCASIEKTPPHSCQNCIYGRNCQNAQHDENEIAKVLLPETEQTYAWNAEEQKLDEELLNAWYFYHYRQFPIQASLC